MRFFPGVIKKGSPPPGTRECGCCGPCCVVARVEVRDCDRGYLVPGATVKVFNTADPPEEVASGETNDTGTVALILPPRKGMKYEVEVSGVVALGSDSGGTDEGDTSTEVDPEVTRKKFMSRCGVNTIVVDYGAVQQICITVLDSGSDNPVGDIPVVLLSTHDVIPKVLGKGVSGESGMACISVEQGGLYGVRVNGDIVNGTHPNPDYMPSYTTFDVPNCEPFEADMHISLVTNNVGCLPILVKGCFCGLAGVSVTLHGKVRRNTDPSGNPFNPGIPAEDWSVTGTTDSNGRIWFCPSELDDGDDPPSGNVVYASVPKLWEGFGSVAYYDADNDQWDFYSITVIDYDPPGPYVAKHGEPIYLAWGPGITSVYLYTPDDHFCRGPSRCLTGMPATLTATITGIGTVTLHPFLGAINGSYIGCIVNPRGVSFGVQASIGRYDHLCTTPSKPWERASISVARRYYPCGAVIPFDPGPISEHVMDLVPISGTDSCPVNITLREGGNVLGVDGWFWVWGNATATLTE
jgi:hypothetical protein